MIADTGAGSRSHDTNGTTATRCRARRRATVRRGARVPRPTTRSIPVCRGRSSAVWRPPRTAVHDGRRTSTCSAVPTMRPEILSALAEGGMTTEETNPKWIFKAFHDDVQIDIIFKTAGHVLRRRDGASGAASHVPRGRRTGGATRGPRRDQGDDARRGHTTALVRRARHARQRRQRRDRLGVPAVQGTAGLATRAQPAALRAVVRPRRACRRCGRVVRTDHRIRLGCRCAPLEAGATADAG